MVKNKTSKKLPTTISDFVLIKDQDGNFKYYREEKFYSLEEVENIIQKETRKQETKKTKPVVSSEQPNEKHGLIKKHSENLIKEAVADIVKELKIQFSTPDFEKRFFNIISSKLRDIRKEKEFLYILTTPKESGGMGVNEKQAQLILKVVDKHADDLQKKRGDLAKKPIEKLRLKEEFKNRGPEHRSGQRKIKPNKVKSKIPIHEEKFSIEDLKKIKPKNSELGQTSTIKKQEPVKEKPPVQPTMTDVVYKAKLVGPVEELKTLDLDNFRRLGDTEKEIKKEVLEKIKILEADSFLKKLQGIRAWQASPVYQLYLQMGYESLEENKNLNDIIVDFQIRNVPSLSLSEIEAIAEINESLEY